MTAPTYPSVDESGDRLHRAGWSVGATGVGPEDALVWYRATQQAAAAGTLSKVKWQAGGRA